MHHAPIIALADVQEPLIYKQYKAGDAPPHGLTAAVARRLRMERTRQRLHLTTAWPVHVVEDGEVLGVLMRLMPDGYFEERAKPSGVRAGTLRDVQYLFVSPARAVPTVCWCAAASPVSCTCCTATTWRSGT